MDLIIGTHNVGKLQEYQELLHDAPMTIQGLMDICLGKLDVDETGTTFVENALLKATTYARASGRIALADDSGLVVDALDGAPGIYSARFGGEGLDDAGRRTYLLEQMKDIPEAERTAHFMCVIAIVNPLTGLGYHVEGKCEGVILTEERGKGGFGYDALFIPNGYEETFAQMSHDKKNSISHRAIAVQGVPEILHHIIAEHIENSDDE